LRISCPECRFEKDIDPQTLKFQTTTATCPKCSHKFHISKPEPEKKEERTVPLEANAMKENAAGKGTAVQAPGAKVIPLPGAKPRQPAPAQKVSFHGKSLTLLRLYVVSNLLSVLTLGVYHFWGKVKIRKYLYGSTEIFGERLSFSGTGKELFLGWLKAMLIIAVVLSVPNALASFVHPAFGLLIIPIMFALLPAVLVGAWRYKLSRTHWHGASFSFSGTAKEFMKIHIKGTLLSLVTLGLYGPYFHAEKERFWRGNSNFGTGSFSYDGKAGDIRKDFLKAWLLTIPTLGLCWLWYSAKVARYDWQHTNFGSLRFSFDATGRQLFSFLAGNMLLLFLSFGLAYPWVVVRGINYFSRHMAMKGEIDFAGIAHAPQSAKAVGEGLAGVLDIDVAM